MSKDVRELAREHHAFYEVLPYCVLVEEKHGSPSATTRTVQVGFDVDVYGVNPENDMTTPEPDPDYTLGCAGLQEIAEQVGSHTGGCCSLEVISFPERVVLDTGRHGAQEGMFRIRIACPGLNQPAGPPEQHVLKELENQLRNMGITRR